MKLSEINEIIGFKKGDLVKFMDWDNSYTFGVIQKINGDKITARWGRTKKCAEIVKGTPGIRTISLKKCKVIK